MLGKMPVDVAMNDWPGLIGVNDKAVHGNNLS
jgi:hypothetical protein